MFFFQRHYATLVCLALVMVVISGGCTSPAATDQAGNPVSADESRFHSSFAELAGTYVSTGNPSSSIILDPTGAARIVEGSSSTDTSIYMEMGVLRLADGTSLGPYPVQDGVLVYQSIRYQKQS
jgi:hypothetical protein